MINFSPITFSEFKALRPVFDKQPHELCPYSLSSIIVWINDTYTPFGAFYGEDFVICARYGENRYLLLPIAPVERYAPAALKDLAAEAGVTTFWFVPREYLDHFGEEAVSACFHIKEQPEHADYIYLTEDLAELKGNAFSKKRNLINQFERAYLAAGRVTVAPVTEADIHECIAFLEEWCIENDCDADHRNDLACEKEAAKNALMHLDQVSSTGLLLKIDGKVCAFGIGDRLTEEMGVLHFEKAFSHIKGLYQYFDRECARRLFEGVRYINKESDMGEPGLRQAKRSYNPVKVVMSYELTVR